MRHTPVCNNSQLKHAFCWDLHLLQGGELFFEGSVSMDSVLTAQHDSQDYDHGFSSAVWHRTQHHSSLALEFGKTPQALVRVCRLHGTLPAIFSSSKATQISNLFVAWHCSNQGSFSGTNPTQCRARDKVYAQLQLMGPLQFAVSTKIKPPASTHYHDLAQGWLCWRACVATSKRQLNTCP